MGNSPLQNDNLPHKWQDHTPTQIAFSLISDLATVRGIMTTLYEHLRYVYTKGDKMLKMGKEELNRSVYYDKNAVYLY